MRGVLIFAIALAQPALAQHDHHAMSMPGMEMPKPAPSPDAACPPEHAAMGHCTPKTPAPAAAPVTAPPTGASAGPEDAADTVYDPQIMSRAREMMRAEHGGMAVGRVMIDRLEWRAHKGRDGLAWEGDAWYGGDYNKLWIKTEGEGAFGRSVDSADVQLLWSRAIRPFFDLQAGVRYDVGPGPSRADLVLGIQGIAPYWFDVDAAAFLSQKGDLTARLEADYDQRLTNRLILQPRVELELAAQDVPENRIGSGLSSAEFGLRLRYQLAPEFAPYLGVSYERKFGDTARFARMHGDEAGGWNLLLGLRAWF